MTTTSDSVHTSVKEYYGKTLETSSDLKTNACSLASAPHPLVLDTLRKIPQDVLGKFYGCGNPIPLGIAGKSLLDLGSGSGRDCYVAASLVGPEGSVTGVDMTDEQLSVARENVEKYSEVLGYMPKLKFLTGYIEKLREAGVPENSIDICISNCVINLSPDKPRVLQGVYDSLRDGGELYFSDLYADCEIPIAVRTDDSLLGEGLAGALYVKEFEKIVCDIGFARPRILAVSHLQIYDSELLAKTKGINYYSVTYRLFKVLQADENELDRGQTATYNGQIQGNECEYRLDVDNVFKQGVPVKVSGNTAALLEHSWLSKYFTVSGPAAESSGPVETSSIESLMDKARSATSSCSSTKPACCGSA